MTEKSNRNGFESRARSKKEVCAIITTYEPEASLRSLIAAAIQQVDRVFLINDSGSCEARKALDKEFADVSELEIHHMPVNSGIAAALNCGLRAARSRQYEKALLLDDDTRISAHLVDTLVQAWERLEKERRNPGVIGVSRSEVLLPANKPDDKKPETGWRPARGVITAGSIVDVEFADGIGGFREEFIIDAVDYEFCARVRRAGLLVARLTKPLIEQPVGNKTTTALAGFRFSTTNHSPLRRYYMYRNNVIFAKEQFFNDPMLSMAILWFLVKTVCLVVCFETQRPRKIKAVFFGVLDGIRSQTGHARRRF